MVGNSCNTCGCAQLLDLRYGWPTRRLTNCGGGGRPGGRPIVVLVANLKVGQLECWRSTQGLTCGGEEWQQCLLHATSGSEVGGRPGGLPIVLVVVVEMRYWLPTKVLADWGGAGRPGGRQVRVVYGCDA